jgi:putative protease
LKVFAHQNLAGVTLSPELKKRELFTLIDQADFSSVELELLVFGALELMVSQFCPVGAWTGKKPPVSCHHPCQRGRYFLRDRKEIDFPVIVDEYCRFHLLNSRYLSLLPELESLKNKNLSLRLELRHQSPELAAKVIEVFQGGLKGNNNFDQTVLEAILGQGLTKGHFYRGVE